MVQSFPQHGRRHYGQVLHGSATTTEAVRRAIQRNQESLRALAKRLGINQKTVAKWHNRNSVADEIHTPMLEAGIKRSGRALADLAASVMASFPQVLRNVEVARRPTDAAGEMSDEIAAVESDLGADGRVLVRASGTEPLVRVMVEAPTLDVAEAVADRLCTAARVRFT